MTPPPACVVCGEPCRTLWTWNGARLGVAPWRDYNRSGRTTDSAILWLCSRCVDAAAGGR